MRIRTKLIRAPVRDIVRLSNPEYLIIYRKLKIDICYTAILTLQFIVLVKGGESHDHGHPVEDDSQQGDGDHSAEDGQHSPGEQDPGNFHPPERRPRLAHPRHEVDSLLLD